MAPESVGQPKMRSGAIYGVAMAITPFTILVILALLLAVFALVPGWNGHALICVSVILLAVSQFLK